METYLCILIVLVLVIAYYSYRERRAASERMSLVEIAAKVDQIRAARLAAKKERLANAPKAAVAKPKSAMNMTNVVPWADFM